MNTEEKILGVVGLGYVGLPLAVSFSKKMRVIGFDKDEKKVELYRNGTDVTNEVGDEELSKSKIEFTTNENDLSICDFLIIAVPTPIDSHNKPDLRPIKSASETASRIIKDGVIVIYESTVYPGLTEEICIPIIEQGSGKRSGKDFFVGYSPERINPGDKVHRFENITKIISASDEKTLDEVEKLYLLVLKNGVHRASSIKVAEAAKVIENTQRDINIAFVNELSIIFNLLDIDTKEVLEAAASKWNFLRFTPGLVGGHCISVDPFYLTYKAEEKGHLSEMLLAGRRINESMGKFVAEQLIKKMIHENVLINKSRVLVYGIGFKEDVADLRNSKVIDIINTLSEYGVEIIVKDYIARPDEVQSEFNLTLSEKDETNLDAIIFAVPHEDYKEMDVSSILSTFNKNHKPIVFDLKRMFDKAEFEKNDVVYWGL